MATLEDTRSIIPPMETNPGTYEASFNISFEVNEADGIAVAIVPALGAAFELPESSDNETEARRAIQAYLDTKAESGLAKDKPGYVAPDAESLPDGAMTLKEVAEAIRKSQSYVSRITSDGRLPSISHNGRKYVTREALDEYMSVEHRRGRRAGYSPGKARAYEYELVALDSKSE